MKKTLFALMGVLAFTPSQSQELLINKGDKIKAETLLYANPLPFNKKWAKMKDSKKEPLIQELNDNIVAGKEKPWRTTLAKFEVIDITKGNGAAKYTVKAYDSGLNTNRLVILL